MSELVMPYLFERFLNLLSLQASLQIMVWLAINK